MLKVTILGLLSGIFGILLCFGGYRFFMVMLPVWAFFGGFWAGAKGVFLLLGEGFLASTTGLVVGLITGLVFGLFAWQFYEFGVALLAAITGAWLGSGLMSVFGFERGWLTALVALVVAAVLGGLTYQKNWQKSLVMGLSAIGGANAIILSLLLFLGRVSVQELQGAGTTIRPILSDSWFWSLLWMGLAIAGLVFQIRSYRYVDFAKEDFAKYWS